MNFSTHCHLNWIFPDSKHNHILTQNLHLAQNSNSGFQILGDEITQHDHIKIENVFFEDTDLRVELFELLPVGVDENTAESLWTTTDYNTVKHFVTNKSPFYVYDALKPLQIPLQNTHFAIYLSVQSTKKTLPNIYHGKLKISINQQVQHIEYTCQVYPVAVPSIQEAKFQMLNFFHYDNVALQHNVEIQSSSYFDVLESYIQAQLDMRCTHIMLPIGVPVYENKQIISFDFDFAEQVGKIAIELGAPYLCSNGIAHWYNEANHDCFLNWDHTIGVSTFEGYRQLKLYFSKWYEIVLRNGWQNKIYQSLADEPQVGRETSYRILACICRKCLPNVNIVEAVETTDLGGAVDIWVPKQEVLERKIEEFTKLQIMGEDVWCYTCAFPGGSIMNRNMDLPLCISRSVLWLCAMYKLKGFLHWGFNFYEGDDLWNKACCSHRGRLIPAGDAHIVYPGENGAWHSMRFEAQRNGAQDYELFHLLQTKNENLFKELIQRVCTSFSKYECDGDLLLQVHKILLEELCKNN